jgi:hypothetical protein
MTTRAATEKRTPAQERSVPLWAFRLMAERDPDDQLGVIPTFYMRLLVEQFEREAKWAREAEREELPPRLTDQERYVELTRRRALTDAREQAAMAARRSYEAALNAYRPPKQRRSGG